VGLEWNRSSGSKGKGKCIAAFRDFSPTLYCWQVTVYPVWKLVLVQIMVLMTLHRDHTDVLGKLYFTYSEPSDTEKLRKLFCGYLYCCTVHS
jgi:hypothetical protein